MFKIYRFDKVKFDFKFHLFNSISISNSSRIYRTIYINVIIELNSLN